MPRADRAHRWRQLGKVFGYSVGVPVAIVLVILSVLVIVDLTVAMAGEWIGRRFPGSFTFWPVTIMLGGWLRSRLRDQRKGGEP